QVVARANQVIASLGKSNLADSVNAVKGNIKGQALFLRAFAYFNLVRYFGPLPLHLKPVTGLNSSFLHRSSVDSVYSRIISDASNAAKLLPNRSKQEMGRVTSGAAWTLMAKVYLTRKK